MNERTDDTSTRARIRDAALRQFAEHGFKGATVRGTAEAAGVSPGLVQHHYPSKQALRDACDSFAFAYIRDAKAKAIATGALTDPSFLADTHAMTVAVTRYTAMALASDSPTASRYFEAYVELTYEVFTSGELGPRLPANEETHDIAVVHTAMHLGQSILFTQMLRAIGLDADDPQAAVRLGRAQVFLSSDRILGAELADRISTGLDRYGEASNVDEGTRAR